MSTMKKRIAGRGISRNGFIEWDWGRAFGGAGLRIGPRRRDTNWDALYLGVGRAEDDETGKPLPGLTLTLQVLGCALAAEALVAYAPLHPAAQEPTDGSVIDYDSLLRAKRQLDAVEPPYPRVYMLEGVTYTQDSPDAEPVPEPPPDSEPSVVVDTYLRGRHVAHEEIP